MRYNALIVLAAIEAYSEGQAKKPDAMEKLFGLRTAIVKVLSSTICVIAGAAGAFFSRALIFLANERSMPRFSR